MTKSPRKNVPDVGIELEAACKPSRHASDQATAPGHSCMYGTWDQWTDWWNGITYFMHLNVYTCNTRHPTNLQNEGLSNENADQLAHLPSLIGVFARLSLGSQAPGHASSCWQLRLRSGHVEMRSPVYLPWVNLSCCRFCCALPDFLIWAATWQSQQNSLCAQRRLRSAWASTQSDAESSLSAWRKFGSLANHWVHSEDSDQTGQMPRLIWAFTGHTGHFVDFVMRWLISFCLFFADFDCRHIDRSPGHHVEVFTLQKVMHLSVFSPRGGVKFGGITPGN